MDNLNIFCSINKTTKRQEPFHSQFLADVLRVSKDSNHTLFEKFWRIATPDDWDVPESCNVHNEYPLGEHGKIDICIESGSENSQKLFLGVEVKTSDSSARPNQLQSYYKGLKSKHPDGEIAITFLTPFNRVRAGDAANRLTSIKEFDEFARKVESAKHISWLDVADIEWDGRDIWRQHQEFVRCNISAQHILEETSRESLDRSLEDFFDHETAKEFWDVLEEIGYNKESGGDLGIDINLIDLELEQASLLIGGIERLISRGKVDVNSAIEDDYPDSERDRFLASRAGVFHRALFDLAGKHPHVWVKGKQNYGVRIAHERHRSSGVSLATSKDTETLNIRHAR